MHASCRSRQWFPETLFLVQFKEDIVSKLKGSNRILDVNYSIISSSYCTYLPLLGVTLGRNNIISPNTTLIVTVSREY